MLRAGEFGIAETLDQRARALDVQLGIFRLATGEEIPREVIRMQLGEQQKSAQ